MYKVDRELIGRFMGAVMFSWMSLHLITSLAGAPISLGDMLLRGLFAALCLLAAWGWALLPLEKKSLKWYLVWLGLMFLAVAACLAVEATWAACLGLAILVGYSLEVDVAWTAKAGRLGRWVVHGALALVSASSSVLLVQSAEHFSEEEFFIALQVLTLALGWLALLASWYYLRLYLLKQPTKSPVSGASFWSGVWIVLVLFFVRIGLLDYQDSSYTWDFSRYPGISVLSPFLCGEAPAEAQAYDGEDVFERILRLVADNPNKSTPEYGMLALARSDLAWAQRFRSALLDEAAQGLYTEAAHTVKSVQYDAALRAYYYTRVRQVFPGLFSAEESAQLSQWFAAINRRAWTVEPVDWMYALAFGEWPRGPYENQESGAGLLAALESGGLSDPALSARNQAYLAENVRGWEERFRNTDDAIVYQPIWMVNALLQANYTDRLYQENARLSLEWLLLQSLPDGARLRYNHVGGVWMAQPGYWAAGMFEDPEGLWLAGRAVENLETQGGVLYAMPGVESAVQLSGASPIWGSCLMYGDSGLPTQDGPLAPDKIVLRDGWAADATYLLLNLRFSGWHRYKATNDIILLYQNGPLVVENTQGETFAWLPEGRSLFRDKRVPRENLNGLIIERRGLSAVLQTLTGIGSPWAQDPPYYAEVLRFETGAEYDLSSTRIEDWHGWDHLRTIYLYHAGPVVVFDQARGPRSETAVLAWHLAGEGQLADDRLLLRGGADPAVAVLLPLGQAQTQVDFADLPEVGWGFRVEYGIERGGLLQTVTVFLTGEWVDAQVSLVQDGTLLQISREGQVIEIPLSEAWRE